MEDIERVPGISEMERVNSVSKNFLRTRAESIQMDNMGRVISNVGSRTASSRSSFQTIASSRKRSGRRNRLQILLNGSKGKSDQNNGGANGLMSQLSERTNSSVRSNSKDSSLDDGIHSYYPEEKEHSTELHSRDMSRSDSDPPLSGMCRSQSLSVNMHGSSAAQGSSQSQSQEEQEQEQEHSPGNSERVWRIWPFRVFRNERLSDITDSPCSAAYAPSPSSTTALESARNNALKTQTRPYNLNPSKRGGSSGDEKSEEDEEGNQLSLRMKPIKPRNVL